MKTEQYVIYIYTDLRNDRRFVFDNFSEAFTCFKRFAREDERIGMFHYIGRRQKLIHQTGDFPLALDRKDVQTHERMGVPAR